MPPDLVGDLHEHAPPLQHDLLAVAELVVLARPVSVAHVVAPLIMHDDAFVVCVVLEPCVLPALLVLALDVVRVETPELKDQGCRRRAGASGQGSHLKNQNKIRQRHKSPWMVRAVLEIQSNNEMHREAVSLGGTIDIDIHTHRDLRGS